MRYLIHTHRHPLFARETFCSPPAIPTCELQLLFEKENIIIFLKFIVILYQSLYMFAIFTLRLAKGLQIAHADRVQLATFGYNER